MSCIVHSSETAMANFPQVIKNAVRILSFKQVSHLWIPEAPGPSDGGHFGDVAAEAYAAATSTFLLHHLQHSLQLEKDEKIVDQSIIICHQTLILGEKNVKGNKGKL